MWMKMRGGEKRSLYVYAEIQNLKCFFFFLRRLDILTDEGMSEKKYDVLGV